MRLLTSLTAVVIAIGTIALPAFGAAIPATAGARSVPSAEETSAPVVTAAPTLSGVLAPGQDLVLDGSIANPTAVALPAATASVYFARPPITSRSVLSDWLGTTAATPVEKLGTLVIQLPTPAVGAFKTAPFELRVPAASLDFGSQSATAGVRAIAVRIADADTVIGDARTSFVWNPGSAVQRTRLSVAFPLTVPATGTGLITAATLAVYTAPDGLLTQELNAVFDTDVAIGIDPRILASIGILGTSTPASAEAWLERLKLATNPTFALSYADSDLALASQAKAPGVLAPTTFPIDQGLFPGESSATPTPSSTEATEPTPSPTPTPVPTLPTAQSLQAYDYSLASLAWPAEDTVLAPDLDTFAAGGLTTTILDSGNAAYGNLDYTPSAAALIDRHPVLIADASISDLVQAAASAPTPLAFTAAIATLSSTLSIISGERPSEQRTVLAALTRLAPQDDVRLRDALTAVSALPWAAVAPMGAALAPFAAGSTVSPVAATIVPRAEPAGRVARMTALLASEAAAASFSSVLVDPTQIVGERRLSLLALLSNSWSGDPAWGQSVTRYLDQSTKMVGSVSIARSSSVQIIAASSIIPVTVTNQLPWPVTVYVSVHSPTSILTVTKQRAVLAIEADSQAKVSIPVTSNANGDSTVEVRLTSTANVAIATPQFIDVNVQAGWETAITAAIAVILVAIFGLGIYRNISKRRRTKAAALLQSTDETPDDADRPAAPPTERARP